MKTNLRILHLALITAGALATHCASAEDNPPPVDPKMAEMMKKAESAGAPGAAHEALKSLVGDWNAEVKCWMAPDAPPTVTRASARSSWVMNGRFIKEEFDGELMGRPFRGIGLTGYDNLKQKYGSVWIDDMHTSIFTTEGTAADDPKVITFTGKMDCPMTGRKDMPVKQVLRIISADKHVFEMYDPANGGEIKTMEITYLRKQP